MTQPIPGYAGKVAHVNLNSNIVKIEETPWNVVANVIGGKGLGAWYLYKFLEPKTPALDPANIFTLATGPAQGVMPIASRYVIVTKSPHTGLYLDSHAGGHLGPELKFSGFDAITVKGAAEKPVWIEVSENQVEIHPADELWGMNTHETEIELHDKHDPKSRVISIGKAGENQVPIACTTSDLFRNAGRGGIGSLFGSKNLKAMSVRGTLDVPVHDDEKVREVRQEINSRLKEGKDTGNFMFTLGTSAFVEIANQLDMLPVLNYQHGEVEGAVDGKMIEKLYKDRMEKHHCYRCGIACSVSIKSPFSWADGMIQLAEYESLALLGSNLGITDEETLLHLNHLCNIHGLDTISLGSTISWFMECVQNDKVPEKYKSEQIRFGDGLGALELTSKIATKEGVGDVLAGGVKRAAEVFGNGTDQWALHVKGLEMPAWDPRGRLGGGMTYAVSPLGGSHLQGWPATADIPDKTAVDVMESLVENQNSKILTDSLIFCSFSDSISPTFTSADGTKAYNAITGFNKTEEEMLTRAANIWLLTRMFNEREFDKTPAEYDVLPYRHMNDPLPSGVAQGRTAFISKHDFFVSRSKLYDLRGLTETGAVSHPVRSNVQTMLHLD
ncbi:MAG: aldehyde ferredoxin oxidoreductase family protein [Candidatus Kariarchaeaceae archaeon]|jgi:aldehyde:ferredoxin oxidoreductase